MKLRLNVLALGLCLCLVLVARTEAQLNFSTGWGKRSSEPQLVYQDDDVAVPAAAEPQDRHLSRLQLPDLDLFFRYYRRFKQIEAQRLASSAI